MRHLKHVCMITALYIIGFLERSSDLYFQNLLAEMTPAQLDADTERMRREVIQLKQEFRQERERLERLAAAYQESKKLNPAQRYVALKEMIKDATASSSSLSSTSSSSSTATSSTSTTTTTSSKAGTLPARPQTATSHRVAVKS
jgi:hypothetical protein